MKNDLIISAILAFIGNSLIAIGQGTQKSQVSAISKDDKISVKIRRGLIWVGGILCSNSGLVLIYIAIGIGYTTIVGAFNAAGLFTLILFSFFVLKEGIDKAEIAGIVFIFSGMIIIPLFPADTIPLYEFSLTAKWGAIGGLIAVFILALFITKIRKRPVGTALAMLAGSLTGISQVFQKVSRLPVVIDKLTPFWGFFHSYIWLVFLAASFLSLQFAYRKHKAITVIPVFNSFAVIVPIFFGQVFFGESLSPIQWAGICFILCGIFVIDFHSRFSKRKV
jgi:drug/metabolite transporter (DMT)-like permease